MMKYHDTRFTYDARREGVWRAIVGFLGMELAGASSVLEIGAGYCSFINAVSAEKRYALDTSDVVRQHAAAGVQAHVQSAAEPFPFADASLDAVLASNLFEHLYPAELERALTEIRRVLRPGGKLIIVQPNFKYAFREYFDDYTHVAIFTEVSLTDRLQVAGFRVDRVMPKFVPYSLKSVGVPVPSFLISLYLRSPWKPKAGQMLLVAVRP